MSVSFQLEIDIIADVTCPWCYIGKKKLERALFGVTTANPEICWLPYQLHPQITAAGLDYRELLIDKYGEEAYQEIMDNVKHTGRLNGIDFHLELIKVRPNTTDSHRLIYWAGEANLQSSMIEALFEAFFCNGRDIGDLETLVSIASERGMDESTVRQRLESDEDRQRVETQSRKNAESGIGGVPFFLFNRQYSLSGAQPVGAFRQVISRLDEENAPD
jgi:predicted DsbA family dithiol-disulfide isomerase